MRLSCGSLGWDRRVTPFAKGLFKFWARRFPGAERERDLDRVDVYLFFFPVPFHSNLFFFFRPLWIL